MSARPGSPALTDRQLIETLLAEGSEWAFRELYRRHTPRVYQIVLRVMGGVEADAEDVLQDAWTRAGQNLAAFRWESSFATWLTGIAINAARSLHRRRGRREMVPVDDSLPGTAPPLVADRVDLERAIALLPAGYRMVLVLHDVEGFTHEEIGTRLGISAGTSKSQLFSARRAMRALLTPPKELSNAHRTG
jgi:RNA polymerase sigma-70 factor (ECF subfamily)